MLHQVISLHPTASKPITEGFGTEKSAKSSSAFPRASELNNFFGATATLGISLTIDYRYDDESFLYEPGDVSFCWQVPGM